MITRLNTWITERLLVVAAVLAFALSFIVVADVIGRVVFNSPLKGTPEMVSGALVIILFLQAPYAVRSGGMINVNFLLGAMPQRMQRYVMGSGALLGAAFFAFVSFGAIEPAIYAWTSNEFEGEGALHVPAWPARFIVVVGSALAAFSYLLLAIDHLRGPAENSDPAPHRSGASAGEA
jgi:TRAP-type C4-dicarboxylate transport system permease small subunit